MQTLKTLFTVVISFSKKNNFIRGRPPMQGNSNSYGINLL